ncbi:MAG: hypothetical protein PVF12_01005, partial [Thiohalocapsa sp.]
MRRFASCCISALSTRSSALLVLLAALLAGGCAGTGGRSGGTDAALPAGADRDELLTSIAACHLRRVLQNEDRGATDAVVIAAIEQYGFE